MIISVGIDIIEVSRIRETMTRTPRFAERIFTAPERAYCDTKGVAAAQHYAARFAAKEACLKALRTGWSGAIKWHDIEISNDAKGAPLVSIGGEAQKVFQSLGATVAHLSLSHTTEHAVATVILEKL